MDTLAFWIAVGVVILATAIFSNDGQANDLFTSPAYVLKCEPMPKQGVKQIKPVKCKVVKL